MKRIKRLGLATIMALACISVTAAATASASWFSAGEYKYDEVNLTGETNGTGVLGLVGGEFACENAISFETTVQGPIDALEGAFSSTECQGRTLTMNGCKLIFHPGDETEPGRFDGTVEIGPSGCGPVEFEHFTQECVASIPPQAGLAAEYVNKGEGSQAYVAVDISATGIIHTAEGPAWCPASGSREDGTYDANWEIHAENEAAESIAVEVKEEVRNLISIAGEQSESEAQQPHLEALSFPVSITGDQDAEGGHVINFAGYDLSCATVGFNSEATAETAALSIDAIYEDPCSYGGLKATVDMNSCSYMLNILNVGPPYVGDLDAVCSQQGDAIEVRTSLFGGTICTTKIAPQSGLDTVGLSNVEFGNVKMDLDVSGIAYSITRKSSFCPGSGEVYEAEDGTYTGTTTLEGWK